MEIWHGTTDAPRCPARVPPGARISLAIGTWPVEPDQSVWVDVHVTHVDGTTMDYRTVARWQRNVGANSYWEAHLASFQPGDRVTYRIGGRSAAGEVIGPDGAFRAGPALYLALLWHQHQPLYRGPAVRTNRGCYANPSVRLHGIRDYYAMAALAAQHPGVHLTINLTPVLLAQIEDYVEHGATDRALELTLTPAEQLTDAERRELLRTFFDAAYDTQIRPHRRYAELHARARAGDAMTPQELRDVQAWANLAWFAKEFRDGVVPLVTGEMASVRAYVEQEEGYTITDIEAIIAEQYKILRAILPIHRLLQEHGQIEVSTSPYFHPILPLLIDTDQAWLDRPGAALPPRFAYPEDADAQVRLAVEAHCRWFGRPPRGMWPAEGAVSPAVVPFFARHGVEWIATDRRVLARSGRWGYRADDPDVLCRPYRAAERERTLAIFFREDRLADHIAFRYHRYADYEQAARDLLQEVKERYATPPTDASDRIVTIALDGENTWNTYREDARAFLQALYRLLESDPDVQTVTFAEYLDGNVARGIAPHPISEQARLFDLATGSWADETGSAPGVDLGTWIGEEEENAAWALLAEVRSHLAASGATPSTAPDAFLAMYAAEGSDWFWWLGTDQTSRRDIDLDALFHGHLAHVYEALGEVPPPHIVPHDEAGRPSSAWTTVGTCEQAVAMPDAP